MKEYFVAHPTFAIAGVVVLGIAAQVIAWRIRQPSILLLLLSGFAVSPACLDIFSPDYFLSKELLFGLVSISIAIILFEGGLSLDLQELREMGQALSRLIVGGSIITWILASVAARLALDFSWSMSVLTGAILIVSGPTVVIPLLRHVRAEEKISSLAKWEGILNDPIGAVAAVLVLEIILPGHGRDGAITYVTAGVGNTILVGIALGVLGAFGIAVPLRNHWIPDYLRGVVVLAVVLLAFAVSNAIQHESGLLTVTLMGLMLANQRQAPVREITAFKEHLRVLLISCLFVLLGARLTPEKLSVIDLRVVIFVALLVVVVRPAAVFLSLAGTNVTWKEKLFLTWMAPRGIVAAAVASLFAIELGKKGIPGADLLEPVLFSVIIGTVALYGFTAMPLARALGIAQANPQGILFVGAQPWARKIAKAVQEAGYSVFMMDTNMRHVTEARWEEIPAYHKSILDEDALDVVDLNGIGRVLALTPNDEANALIAVHCSEEFGTSEVYQLSPDAPRRHNNPEKRDLLSSPAHLRGRILFGNNANFTYLRKRFLDGAEIKVTGITDQFTYEDFRREYGDDTLPLFIVRDDGVLEVCSAALPRKPAAGETVIAIV